MLAGFLTLAAAQELYSIPADLAYKLAYTFPGKCLENTQFDPDHGAEIFTGNINGGDIVTVVPQSPNFQPTNIPAVLSFSDYQYGLLGLRHAIHFADSATGAFLADRCGESGGY